VWLRAVAGGTEDRGWSMLSDKAQATYSGDSAAYRREVDATDWEAFQWNIDGLYDQDGTWVVLVDVEGGWAAVPAFIRERPLAQIHCRDGGAAGFVVLVTFPAGEPLVDPGVRTGSADAGRCP